MSDPSGPSPRSFGRSVFSVIVILAFVLPAAAAGNQLATWMNVPRLFVVAVSVIVAFGVSQKAEAWAWAKMCPGSVILDEPSGKDAEVDNDA